MTHDGDRPRGNDRGRDSGQWWSGDRGSGTVLTLALVLVAVALIGVIALLARAESARGSAQSAADLGAIAAAQRLAVTTRSGVASTAGSGSSHCAVARTVVAANGASLTRCELLGAGVVQVSTARDGGLGTARASARAGPAAGRVG